MVDQDVPTTITVTGYDFATQTFECECDAPETAAPKAEPECARPGLADAPLPKSRRVK